MATRRAKGDGGLIQRHDHPTCPPLIDGIRAKHSCRGRWVGTLDFKDAAGHAKRKAVYGRTQAEAKRKLDQARRDRDKGALVATSPTVAAWMADWMEKRKRPPKPLKPQTWNGYETKIRTYIIPALGKRKLGDLRPQHIEAMYDDLRGRGLAEATVRQTHAILQRALKDAVRLGHLGATPIDRVQPPGTEVHARDQFTLEQAAQALRVAGDSARWWLALFYGMRQGEVLGLRWGDVDWSAHTLAVTETRQRNYKGEGQRIITGDPKSRASKRILPMLGQIEMRLRLLWETVGEPHEGLVFPSPTGGLRDSSSDYKDWRAFLHSAGLPHIALHAARNTASSMMEAAGIPDRVVAQILGQAQVRTTHGYQRAELERVRGYLERVGAVLEIED